MKSIAMLLITLLSLSSLTFSQKKILDQRAGNLRLVLAKSGRITTLENVTDGTNYVVPGEASYLLECQKYGADSTKAMLQPESMKIINQTKTGTKIELSYKEGVRLTVLITPKKDYFRMELTNAVPVAEISQIVWGPYKTTMRGLIGEWLGLNRSNSFTLGLLTLEPNTDGISKSYMPISAAYTNSGSLIQLTSFDHTLGRFVRFVENGNEQLRKSVPIPGLTVIGSKVALFGCPAGKSNELGVVEKIELGEGLPHPTFGGQWNKYSKEGQKFCVWANYKEENFKEYLNLTKEMGARILCRPGGFSGNWGHFEINPKIYPGGIQAISEDNKLAKSKGVGLTLYTLTTFLKPNPDPEPYLTPVPDERLQTWKPQTNLIKDLSPEDKEVVLQNSEGVAAVLKVATNKVIRIDNEFIEFKGFTVDGNRIIAKECTRGAFFTSATNHLTQSKVRLMFVAGYHNFYPGTLELSNEFSERLVNILLKTDLDNFVVDGFESCMETGYGNYTGNIFLRNFYNKCVENKKEVLATTSIFSQYTWHIFSHISWGEGDQERGVRGTMLDYRLSRQARLSRNLMPNKLGQYYPNNATAEDIEWIMAFVTGWDSGVDFHLDIKAMQKNPEYQKIVETLRLWDQARAENAFTEKQKMALRQTDVLYQLTRKPDGGWNLKFDRFWQNEKIKVLPPSVMAAAAVNGGKESVRPCSIDWSWTHNPGLYDEVGLSDDLIQRSGTTETSWTVNYPSYTESKRSWYPTSDRHFQFVLRLPKNAPCAVRNFKVSLNNNVVEIPVTLQPGQYISIPHLNELACVYNENHQVIGEINLHAYLPKVAKGTTATVSLSCEPLDAKTKPEVILNIRCQNGYFYQ